MTLQSKAASRIQQGARCLVNGRRGFFAADAVNGQLPILLRDKCKDGSVAEGRSLHQGAHCGGPFSNDTGAR